MEKSVAKKPRLEAQNAEEINQKLRQVIKKPKAQIQQLEKQLLELPNEIWLEIMSYLSTSDVLINVAQVSKRFHELSEDPNVIRKIEVDPAQFWPKEKEEKYCNDFLEVLKRSRKLKILSFGLSWDIDNDKSGKKFLEALPSMNHQLLQEFCLKGDGKTKYENASKFLNPFPEDTLEYENILKYLQNCPNLKVLKFEFKPQLRIEDGVEVEVYEYPLFSDIQEGITSLKLKNLQELHLIGVDMRFFLHYCDDFKIVFERIAENLPKLQRLCFTCQDIERVSKNLKGPHHQLCREFASEKNIRLEICTMSKQDYDCKYLKCGSFQSSSK